MLHRFVLHNNEIREASEAMLSPGQVGLLSGWGVFSTVKVTDGVPFAFERHWAGMQRDAEAFHIALPGDSEQVRLRLIELVDANQAFNCTMRLAVVRNVGGLWEGPGNRRPSDLIALTAESKDWGEGVKLTYGPNARHAACSWSGAKILSWAMNLTRLENAQCRGFDEVILLNELGNVAECTSANIFIANGPEVWTPPLSAGCLPGITREILLGEIQIPGLRVAERDLKPEELESAEEVFITSTTRDLLPVLEIDGRTVGGANGVRQALQGAFSEFTRRYIHERKERPRK